jgi:hypothetical protein
MRALPGPSPTLRICLLLAVALALPIVAAGVSAPRRTSCVVCHTSPDSTSARSAAISRDFKSDIHAKTGLSCHDCHGGNPDPALADDLPGAMDPTFAANPFVGVPERGGIPAFCGRCHSSLSFMRRFNPAARVDQEAEYWTSRHGALLKGGDAGVATCIDCHGVHGVRGVGDSQSPVHPTKVAETCNRCHANPKLMQGRLDARGKPIPLDQYARWRQSVHAAALFEKGDLTAPTCNDCHGNHGARPPGVDSVANVCGQCHGREAELFRSSPKQAAFAAHNEFLQSAGDCSSCHDALKPSVSSLDHFSECVTCHENHGVVRPTVALLGVLPETPCAFCHEGVGDIARELPESEKRVENYIRKRDELLQGAAVEKVEGDARFDWLVQMAQTLPMHVSGTDESGELKLRPEFAHLFQKFRIGQMHYVFPDPVTGKIVRAPVRRCTDCHTAADSTGRKAAAAMVNAMREVTALSARAERILLNAKRGGVEVGTVHAELDAAVDGQIELEVLVHSFSAEGEFAKKHSESVAHAAAAVKAGQNSLDELAARRKGLAASLGVIALVLLGLGLKIRDLSRRRS